MVCLVGVCTFDSSGCSGCYEELDEWRIAADETDAGSALSDGGGDGHDSLWHEEVRPHLLS